MIGITTAIGIAVVWVSVAIVLHGKERRIKDSSTYGAGLISLTYKQALVVIWLWPFVAVVVTLCALVASVGRIYEWFNGMLSGSDMDLIIADFWKELNRLQLIVSGGIVTPAGPESPEIPADKLDSLQNTYDTIVNNEHRDELAFPTWKFIALFLAVIIYVGTVILGSK